MVEVGDRKASAVSGEPEKRGRVAAILPGAFGLSLLVLIIAWLAGSFDEKIQPDRHPADRRRVPAGQATDLVHEVTKQTIAEVIGTLKAANRTMVSPRVMATIEEVAVVAGQQVNEGDVLVRLDDREIQARLDQARQSLARARAVRREASLAYERAKPLYAKKVLSQSEFERAEAKFAVADANHLQAEQSVREAEVMLSYTTVVAPRSGRIVDRLAEPGDVARPGEALLVLYDAGSLRLEAPVSEGLAVKMRPGDRLEVYVDAVDAEIEATVDEIVPQADAPSRSFLVKVSLPRSETLYEGMFGRLRIPAGERRHLCLDTTAIQRIGQLEFVDVVRPDDTLERRFIKTGRLGFENRIEVLSGLEVGERVLLIGKGPTGVDG